MDNGDSYMKTLYFICSKCGKICKTRDSLNEHIQRHLPKTTSSKVSEKLSSKKTLKTGTTSSKVSEQPTTGKRSKVTAKPSSYKRQCEQFECGMCGEQFLLQYEFENHLDANCDNQVGAITAKASKSDRNKLFLNSSKRKLPVADPLGEKTKNSQNLNIHLKSKVKLSLKCKICGKQCFSKRQMYKHMWYHRNVNRYKCDVCNRGFISQKQLELHTSIHIRAKKLDRTITNAVISSVKKLPSQLNNKTKQKQSENLNVHLESNGDWSLTCKICGKKFDSKDQMYKHMWYHRNVNRYKCTVCKRGFISQKQLELHALIHGRAKKSERTITRAVDSSVQKLPSQLNNKTKQKQSENLNVQLESNGDWSLTCKICGKKFVSTDQMSKHMWRHRNANRYKCAVCNKGYTCQSHLEMHASIHIKAKQSKRTIINAVNPSVKKLPSQLNETKDKQPQSLNVRFEPNKDSSLTCKICGKKFDSKDQMSKHMWYHRNMNRYKCTVCKRDFMSQNQLKKHGILHRRKAL